MVNNHALNRYCATYLKSATFADYAPNGLQIEGKQTITKIVSGVSANLALIERAIEAKADALLVHHGFFWKNESSEITGIKRNRIALLLQHNINLFAYHLPLDAHLEVGNNAQLGKLLGIQNATPIGKTLVWQGDIELSLAQLSAKVTTVLQRPPLVFGDPQKPLKKIAWCSGAAQNSISEALSISADVYLSGEVSEPIPAIANENNIAYICAGHHATERYGVQALGQHLSAQFGLVHQFIEIENCV